MESTLPHLGHLIFKAPDDSGSCKVVWQPGQMTRRAAIFFLAIKGEARAIDRRLAFHQA